MPDARPSSVDFRPLRSTVEPGPPSRSVRCSGAAAAVSCRISRTTSSSRSRPRRFARSSRGDRRRALRAVAARLRLPLEADAALSAPARRSPGGDRVPRSRPAAPDARRPHLPDRDARGQRAPRRAARRGARALGELSQGRDAAGARGRLRRHRRSARGDHRGGRRALACSFSAGDFFQNNPFLLPQLAAHVAAEAAAGGARFLVDAYCGSGLLGLAAAPRFERVLGVEVSSQRRRLGARQRRAATAATNCEFLAADASAIFAARPLRRPPTRRSSSIRRARAAATTSCASSSPSRRARSSTSRATPRRRRATWRCCAPPGYALPRPAAVRHVPADPPRRVAWRRSDAGRLSRRRSARARRSSASRAARRRRCSRSLR